MPPGLQPLASIWLSFTSGRNGSRFQLALPGSANSAICQWQMNCARMPGRSASGDSASTSVQASAPSALVPISPAAARPDGVGNTRRLDRSAQCTHSVWSMNGGPGCGSTGLADATPAVAMASDTVAAASTAVTARRTAVIGTYLGFPGSWGG